MVALLMGNRADYAAIWLGLTRVGVVVALLNTHLSAPALAHCLRVAGLATRSLPTRLLGCATRPRCCEAPFRVLVHDGEQFMGRAQCGRRLAFRRAVERDESREVTLSDRALYIFTSGTTGLPKAAIVTHRKVMNWSLWFSGLDRCEPEGPHV